MRLSVIIPTLNEATKLGRTLELVHTRSVAGTVESVVADCGSADETVAIARWAGVPVVNGSALTSRARACNAGARLATGDTFLFLHADSEVPGRFDRLIADALTRRGVVGGAFEFKLDGPESRLRIVERVNRLRYRCLGRYYGDQGIFVRRDVFRAVGGYPDVPILEDARFCERAGGHGKMRLLPVAMRTSARRFYNGGILRTLALDTFIWALDFLQFDVGIFAGLYRAENLRRGRTRDRDPSRARWLRTPSSRQGTDVRSPERTLLLRGGGETGFRSR